MMKTVGRKIKRKNMEWVSERETANLCVVLLNVYDDDNDVNVRWRAIDMILHETTYIGGSLALSWPFVNLCNDYYIDVGTMKKQQK